MTRSARILLRVTNSTGSNSSSTSPEMENVESDIVVILAALLCAVMCVVGLMALVRCAWFVRSSDRSDIGNAKAGNKGLKRKVVNSFPIIRYGREEGNSKFGTSECAICLGEYGEGEEIRVLGECGHGFHVGCIDKWLSSHSSCPSCRTILGVVLRSLTSPSTHLKPIEMQLENQTPTLSSYPSFLV